MSMTINEQNKWLERNSRYGEVNENVIRSVFGNGGGSGDNTVYMDAETEFWPLILPEGRWGSVDKQTVETILTQLKSGKKIVVTSDVNDNKIECQLAYADQADYDGGSARVIYLFFPFPPQSGGYFWQPQVYEWWPE